MIVSYRMNGHSGQKKYASISDLGIAFNRIAGTLILRGWLPMLPEIGKNVRYEGKVKIGKKKYSAISQGGLIVIKGSVKIPDQIKLDI